MRRARLAALVLLALAALSAGCATVSLLQSVDALIQQARELLDARRFDEALAKLSEAIRRDPTRWRPYLYAAQAHLGKRDWTAALASARKALELDPASAAELGPVLLEGGRRAAAAGAPRDAIGLLREYLRLEPADAGAYLELGKAYWTAGERGDALAAFRRVLELAPQNEEARRWLFGR